MPVPKTDPVDFWRARAELWRNLFFIAATFIAAMAGLAIPLFDRTGDRWTATDQRAFERELDARFTQLPPEHVDVRLEANERRIEALEREHRGNP